MEFYSFKRILFLLVIALCFYVVYVLVQRRQGLLNDYEEDMEKDIMEPFETNDKKFATIANNNNTKHPLKEYVIMSAWNACATTDGNVSLAQLQNVIQRGYRFLDAEVHVIKDEPHIGFSTEKRFDNIESPNPIKFYDFCKKISEIAFMDPSPNGAEPLFVHLRIKFNQNELHHLESMAESMMATWNSKLFNGKVSGNLPIHKLLGKIVVIIDKSYVDVSKHVCEGNCQTNIKEYMHIHSGTVDFPSKLAIDKLEETPATPLDEDDGISNVVKWQMVTPGLGELYEASNHDDFSKLLMRYSVQIVPHKVYYLDDNCLAYEDFFKDCGKRAFVPLAVAYNYYKKD